MKEEGKTKKEEKPERHGQREGRKFKNGLPRNEEATV